MLTLPHNGREGLTVRSIQRVWEEQSNTTNPNNYIANMKSFSFLAILPCASVAFQQAAPVQHRQAMALNYFPEKFKEAELCATEYGECSLAEMEKLAAGM